MNLKEYLLESAKPNKTTIDWWNSHNVNTQKQWIKDHPEGHISQLVKANVLKYGKKYGEPNLKPQQQIKPQIQKQSQQTQQKVINKSQPQKTEIIPGQPVQQNAKGQIPVPMFAEPEEGDKRTDQKSKIVGQPVQPNAKGPIPVPVFAKPEDDKEPTNKKSDNEEIKIANLHTLNYTKVTNEIFNTIKDEGLDDEQNAPNKKDWEYTILQITKEDQKKLKEFNDDILEKYNEFDIKLKEKYNGKIIDLIDYDNGIVRLVRKIEKKSLSVESDNKTELHQPLKHNIKKEHINPEIIKNASNKAADVGHQKWQLQWKLEHGDEKREKTTKDENWIKEHGTNKVDIAHTQYDDLPEDWKKDNLASGTAAINGLKDGIEKGIENEDELIEHASDLIHKDWLKRNGEWAPESQKLDYKDLSEEEKEKDRLFVKSALKEIQGSIQNEYENMDDDERHELTLKIDKEEDMKETEEMRSTAHKKLFNYIGKDFLHVRDHSSQFVQKQLEDLSTISEDVWKKIKKSKVLVHYHIGDRKITEQDDMRHLRHKSFNEFTGNNIKRTRYWDEVGGVYDTDNLKENHTLVVSSGPTPCPAVALHEFGHAIYSKILISLKDKRELENIHKKYKHLCYSYFNREDDIRTSVNEMFAEAVACYPTKNYSTLLKYEIDENGEKIDTGHNDFISEIERIIKDNKIFEE